MPRFNPPLPIAGKPIFQVSVLGVVDGQAVQTDMIYLKTTGTLATGDEQALSTRWQTSNQVAFLAAVANDFALTGIRSTCLSDLTRIPFTQAVGNVPGTGGATHIPIEMAAILTRNTDIKGQHGAGRMYMPAIPSGFVTPAVAPNGPNIAGIVAYLALNVALATTLNNLGDTFDLAVATRPTPWANWTRAKAITTTNLRTLFGTIRRRRPGRGK